MGGEIEALAARVSGSLGCGPASRVFRHAGKHEAEHEAFGLHAWYRVACAPAAASDRSARAFAALSSFLASGDHDGVVLVEPDYEIEATWSPNDPLFHNNQFEHYRAIHLEEAWEVATGSMDLIVQVVDTGLDVTHPDIASQVWNNAGEICGNGLDDDDNGYVDDCHGYNHVDDVGSVADVSYIRQGHGTHVAGTIGAVSNNGLGGAGVAGGDGSPNTGVRLVANVIFGEGGNGGFAEALVYGADKGARISSNSWSYTQPKYVNTDVLDAIDYAVAKGAMAVGATRR